MVGCEPSATATAGAPVLVGSVALNLLALAVACWLLFLHRRGSSPAHKPPPPPSDVEVSREAGEAVTFTKGADGSFTLANGQIRAVWAIPASGQSTWAVTYGARPPSGGGGESAAAGSWVDVARKLGVQIEVRTVEPSFSKWEDRFLCGTALVDGMPKPYGRAHARAPVAPRRHPTPPPHKRTTHT